MEQKQKQQRNGQTYPSAFCVQVTAYTRGREKRRLYQDFGTQRMDTYVYECTHNISDRLLFSHLVLDFRCIRNENGDRDGLAKGMKRKKHTCSHLNTFRPISNETACAVRFVSIESFCIQSFFLVLQLHKFGAVLSSTEKQISLVFSDAHLYMIFRIQYMHFIWDSIIEPSRTIRINIKICGFFSSFFFICLLDVCFFVRFYLVPVDRFHILLCYTINVNTSII